MESPQLPGVITEHESLRTELVHKHSVIATYLNPSPQVANPPIAEAVIIIPDLVVAGLHVRQLHCPAIVPIRLDEREYLAHTFCGPRAANAINAIRNNPITSPLVYVCTLLFVLLGILVYAANVFSVNTRVTVVIRIVSWVCAPVAVYQQFQSSARLVTSMVVELLHRFDTWYLSGQVASGLICFLYMFAADDQLVTIWFIVCCWTAENTILSDAWSERSRQRVGTTGILVIITVSVFTMAICLVSTLSDHTKAFVMPGSSIFSYFSYFRLNPIIIDPSTVIFEKSFVVVVFFLRFAWNHHLDYDTLHILKQPYEYADLTQLGAPDGGVTAAFDYHAVVVVQFPVVVRDIGEQPIRFLRVPTRLPIVIDESDTIAAVIFGEYTAAVVAHLREKQWLSAFLFSDLLLFNFTGPVVWSLVAFEVEFSILTTVVRFIGWFTLPCALIQLTFATGRLIAPVLKLLLRSFEVWYLLAQLTVFLIAALYLYWKDTLLCLWFAVCFWTCSNMVLSDAMSEQSRRRAGVYSMIGGVIICLFMLAICVMSPLSNNSTAFIMPGSDRFHDFIPGIRVIYINPVSVVTERSETLLFFFLRFAWNYWHNPRRMLNLAEFFTRYE